MGRVETNQTKEIIQLLVFILLSLFLIETSSAENKGDITVITQALQITTDELLGVKPVKRDRGHLDPGLRSLWKKFQQVTSLPEKDQRAVIRLINSLALNTRERRKAS